MGNVMETASKVFEFAVQNNQEETKAETTKDKPTFFVRFSGHCCLMEIEIFPFGWDDNAASESYYLPLDSKNAEAQLQYAYDRMTAIQDEWNSSRA